MVKIILQYEVKINAIINENTPDWQKNNLIKNKPKFKKSLKKKKEERRRRMKTAEAEAGKNYTKFIR